MNVGKPDVLLDAVQLYLFQCGMRDSQHSVTWPSEAFGMLPMRVERQEWVFGSRRTGARRALVSGSNRGRAFRNIGASDRQCQHLRKLSGSTHAGSEIQRAVQSKHLID